MARPLFLIYRTEGQTRLNAAQAVLSIERCDVLGFSLRYLSTMARIWLNVIGIVQVSTLLYSLVVVSFPNCSPKLSIPCQPSTIPMM